MNNSSPGHSSNLTKAAVAFGALTIALPCVCGAFSIAAIPDSLTAPIMGLLMLPMSVATGLFLWQGLRAEQFVEDAFRVLFLQRTEGLRQDYAAARRQPGRSLVMIPTSVFVCALCGYLASILSHRPVGATTGLYATLGLVYGLVLFGVVRLWVLPLMADAQSL